MTWINPPLSEFGERNVAIRGIGRRHHAAWAGPFSIKTIRRGSAAWSTSEGRFLVGSGSALLVNEAEPYTIDVNERQPVETFCIFFRRGFVEDGVRTAATPPDRLLDDLETAASCGFFSRLHPDLRLRTVLEQMAAAESDSAWEDACFSAIDALCAMREDVRRERARIPAVRASTREELYRRLIRGLNYLEDAHDAAPDLTAVARHACLSPFHFHRLFRTCFRETPQRYLARRRLERAAGMLKHSDVSVTQVCTSLGLSSLPSFVRDFRRHFGIAPGEYRRGA